jgi:hypothetical protein
MQGNLITEDRVTQHLIRAAWTAWTASGTRVTHRNQVTTNYAAFCTKDYDKATKLNSLSDINFIVHFVSPVDL